MHTPHLWTDEELEDLMAEMAAEAFEHWVEQVRQELAEELPHLELGEAGA